MGLDDSFRVSATFGQLFLARFFSWLDDDAGCNAFLQDLGQRGDLMAFVVDDHCNIFVTETFDRQRIIVKTPRACVHE